MREHVATPCRNPERVPFTQVCQVAGQIEQPLCHQMHDAAFALDLAVDRHHRGSKHDAALLFEQARPDDDIGNARLVLDGQVR